MLQNVEVLLLLLWSTYEEKQEKQANIEEENGNVMIIITEISKNELLVEDPISVTETILGV